MEKLEEKGSPTLGVEVNAFDKIIRVCPSLSFNGVSLENEIFEEEGNILTLSNPYCQ